MSAETVKKSQSFAGSQAIAAMQKKKNKAKQQPTTAEPVAAVDDAEDENLGAN